MKCRKEILNISFTFFGVVAGIAVMLLEIGREAKYFLRLFELMVEIGDFYWGVDSINVSINAMFFFFCLIASHSQHHPITEFSLQPLS